MKKEEKGRNIFSIFYFPALMDIIIQIVVGFFLQGELNYKEFICLFLVWICMIVYLPIRYVRQKQIYKKNYFLRKEKLVKEAKKKKVEAWKFEKNDFDI